jgi:hypothetical protein
MPIQVVDKFLIKFAERESKIPALPSPLNKCFQYVEKLSLGYSTTIPLPETFFNAEESCLIRPIICQFSGCFGKVPEMKE